MNVLKVENEKNRLEFGLATFFLIALIIIISILHRRGIDVTKRIPFYDFFILSLAVFRLTRLFVYDGIMQFVRDMFLVKTISTDEKTGEKVVERSKAIRGLRRVFCELLGCPWCIGMWMSFWVIILYFFIPESWLLFLILAIAGFSSFIQITINAIGWTAEKEKIEVKKIEE